MLTDWITAISTAITGIMAGSGTFFGYLAFAEAKKNKLPIIEIYLSKAKSEADGFDIKCRVSIRNRLDENLTVQVIRAIHPKEALFALPEYNSVDRNGHRQFGAVLPGHFSKQPNIDKITIKRAFSTGMDIRGNAEPTDIEWIDFYIKFPDQTPFDGLVEVEFLVSSTTTYRNKRMTAQGRF